MLSASVAVNLGQDMTDDALLARILAGDLRYFETLMRRHNRLVFRAARAVVADDAEADDVMQDAYVHAYATLTHFDRRSSFATWIARIAVHEAIGRARKVRLRSLARGLDGRHSGVRTLEPARPVGMLELCATAAIDALPDGLRRAFVLREVEELSAAEIGRILGFSEEAVKAQVQRARALLQWTVVEDLGDDVRRLYTLDLDRSDRVVSGALERLATRFADGAVALAAAS